MDKEIEDVRKSKVIENGSTETEEVGMQKVIEETCKYYNKENCKYKIKFRFINLEQVCKGHIEDI
jgi:hypothetical protein